MNPKRFAEPRRIFSGYSEPEAWKWRAIRVGTATQENFCGAQFTWQLHFELSREFGSVNFHADVIKLIVVFIDHRKSHVNFASMLCRVELWARFRWAGSRVCARLSNNLVCSYLRGVATVLVTWNQNISIDKIRHFIQLSSFRIELRMNVIPIVQVQTQLYSLVVDIAAMKFIQTYHEYKSLCLHLQMWQALKLQTCPSKVSRKERITFSFRCVFEKRLVILIMCIV